MKFHIIAWSTWSKRPQITVSGTEIGYVKKKTFQAYNDIFFEYFKLNLVSLSPQKY